MLRIRPLDRPETVRRAPRETPAAAAASRPETGRAVVPLVAAADRGGSERPAASGGGRPLAGFLAQLIAGADPSLAPSRAARMGFATARYEAAAQLV